MKSRQQARRPDTEANLDTYNEISPPETPSPAKRNLSPKLASLSVTAQRAYPFILIVTVAWIANFLHFTSFGYYEDDWYYFPSAFGQSFSARFGVMLSMMKSFLQGRPLLLLYVNVFGYIGKLFSSISLPYVLAFLFLCTTALLLYRVLRMRFPRLFCTLVSLLFVLSPLTTVRQNLVIELMMGPAFVGILVAVLIRRRRPVFSYLLAVLTLLTYESIFLLFLGAPLLERGRIDRRKMRAFALHLTICAAILAAFALVRHAFAEQRMLAATSLGAVELLKQTITFDLSFTFRSFWSYVYATSVAWREMSLESAIYAFVFLPGALILLLGGFFHYSAGQGGSSKFSQARWIWWFRNGCLGGLLFISLGYLTVFFQASGAPVLFSGRDTRFSASAAPGSSVLIASLLILAVSAFRQPVLKWIARGFTILLLSTLLMYSFIVQYDYIRAWEYQKNFLSQLVILTPDLLADSLVVVRTGPNPQPGFGPENRSGSIGWQRFGLQVSLKCLGNWFYSPEIVFVDSDDWNKYLTVRPDGKIYWKQNIAGSVTQSFLPGRVIVLNERADGLLSRSDEPVTVDGTSILQAKGVNLARGKPARQSSTFLQFDAGRGVDGVNRSAWRTIDESRFLERIVSASARTALTETVHKEFSGFHTNYEPNPWWEVDLGRSYTIEQVRIHNGQPGFYQRAATIRILVSDDSKTWKAVHDNSGKVFGDVPLVVNLTGIFARYVRLQLAAPNWLHLEEVEVFGR